MAKYYRQQGETKRRKTVRILRPFVLLIFIGALFGIGVFLYDVFQQKDSSDAASQLTRPTLSTVDSDTQVYVSPYFQFKAPSKWRAVTAESKDGKYVYRQFKSTLVEQDLVIQVNDSAQVQMANTRISRVLPLIINNEKGVDVVNTTLEHCKKVVSGSMNARIVTMDKVTFPCAPDSRSYEVVVGLADGSNIMTLPRPSNGVAVYKITYRNLTANPNPQDLLSIMKSFETK